jgi:uncharacterized membrane protein YphA (DoxX/SURF4 family)
MNTPSARFTWLEYILCVAMAALFLVAAVPKISQPDEFAKAVHAYKMVPDVGVNLVAIFLPWVEAVAALALLGPRVWRRAGLALCLIMLLVFTAAQTINIFRGVKGTCGCFGNNSKPIGWSGVALNSAFLLGGAFAWRLQGRGRRVSSPS